jgi:hypothetical protein
MPKINADQLDIVASELEVAGTGARQLSLKPSGVTEGKLGFSWVTVDIPAASFAFGGTRSTFTLAQAASSDGNVLDNAELLRNGIGIERVTTTAAVDEWSVSGTTLSVHGDITATGDGYTIRYVVGTSSGAASASGNQVWLGTLPQNPLHAKSDYFQDSTLDPKWSEIDSRSTLTVTEDSDGLELVQTSFNGVSSAGPYQVAPTDDQFCITTQLRMSGTADPFQVLGMFVGETFSGPTDTTTPFVDITLLMDASTWTLEFRSRANSQASGSILETITNFMPPTLFMRLYVDRTGGGTVTPLVSVDGRDWIELQPPTAWAGLSISDVTTIGLYVNNNNSGSDLTVRSNMFRVDITADPHLRVGGYVGTSVPSTFQDGPRDVSVSGNNTLNQYGWADRKVKLIKVEAFSFTPATVGAYTFALTKDPGGTDDNMLSTATFDMTSLSAITPTEVPLTSTVDDLIMDAGDVWRAQFVSDNAGLDAAGVYFSMTWLVL